MNGIVFEKHKNHFKDWKLVTVRYRTDAKELRITYANDLAWKFLMSGKAGSYPDGAMFSKIAYKTEQDPAFLSSEVPSRSRRYQFMLKDSKKYKETAGWGYALFDENGVTFNEDPVVKTQSCHACHTVVKSKDYVFSEPIPFAAGEFLFKPKPFQVSISWETVDFEKIELGDLTKKELDLVKKMGKIQRIHGPFERAVFSGTFDEILPNLIEKARSEQLPAAFYSDSANYSLVIPTEGKCVQVKILFKKENVKELELCN